MTNIFVFGASGRVGGRFAALKVAEGHEVHGLTRSDANAAALHAAGIMPIVDDIRNHGSFLPIAAEADTVLLATADAQDQDIVEIDLIEALASEIPDQYSKPHVIKLSAQSAGLDPPRSFGIFHRRSEAVLETGNLPYTILRPTSFLQSLLLFAADIASKRKFVAPAGKGRIAMVGVDDIARTAAAVADSAEHHGKTYTLTGPTAHSLHDFAKMLSSRLSTKVSYSSPPAFVAKIVLPLVTGMPRWQSNLVVDLLNALSQGAQEAVSNDVLAVTGRPPQSLDAFLDQEIEAFRKTP